MFFVAHKNFLVYTAAESVRLLFFWKGNMLMEIRKDNFYGVG